MRYTVTTLVTLQDKEYFNNEWAENESKLKQPVGRCKTVTDSIPKSPSRST